ncbi:MAG: GntR family transcriptional regulator [Burkholderiaceae bacterium]|nr:GntR family transcriptional regulator [Burkholderiaceae bacterium]
MKLLSVPALPARSPAPSRHTLVTRALMDGIATGRYAVGGLLPSEAELCLQLGVSRTTLREAMRALRDRGLVLPRAGVGTLVLAARPSTRYVHSVDSISDVFQYAKNSRRPNVLSAAEVKADADEAELLRCPVAQRWLRVELTRTFRGDRSPILCARVYVPRAYASVAKLIPTRSAPIYTLLESELGITVLGVEQEFKSVALDARTAAHLGTVAGAPGLSVVRHYLGAADRLLLVTASLYRADRYSYKMRLRFNPQQAPKP